MSLLVGQQPAVGTAVRPSRTALTRTALTRSAGAGHPLPGALLDDPPATTIDLCGRLGAEVESLPGYQGVAW